MDDLMNCLYSFVLENRLGDTVNDREYRNSIDEILRQESKLRESMNKEQRRELNALLSEISAQNSLENEYIFREALRLARELNALVRA